MRGDIILAAEAHTGEKLLNAVHAWAHTEIPGQYGLGGIAARFIGDVGAIEGLLAVALEEGIKAESRPLTEKRSSEVPDTLRGRGKRLPRAEMLLFLPLHSMRSLMNQIDVLLRISPYFGGPSLVSFSFAFFRGSETQHVLFVHLFDSFLHPALPDDPLSPP